MEKKLINLSELNFNDFNLIKNCAQLLRSSEENNLDLARTIIIKSLESRDSILPDLIPIWNDLIEAAGFYPYLLKENIILTSIQSEIRQNYFKSDYIDNIYYHDQQKEIFDIIMNNQNIIVSAPTSFGKSLLIEEVVSARKFTNIVIIQPTIALLDETRKKLNKYSDHYKIIVRTSQVSSSENNIYLFTAERVMEYEHFRNVDFLVIDEFYKLSARRDDERSDSLNNAFCKLYYLFKPQFYMLGPNIDKISEGFTEKYHAIFYKTKYTLVLNESIDYYKAYPDMFGSRGRKAQFKMDVLFELLLSLKDEQTIIYCSSPARVKKIARDFAKFLNLKNIQKTRNELPLADWIRHYIDPRWSLLDTLNYSIGIHDGSLPKHMTSSMIEYFNSKLLNYLFCTTTIIEGVNTTSKNIIFFDSVKGRDKRIDYFDYSNIKGRAGRLMYHYSGKIYNFNEIPQKESVKIDIPFYDQNPVSNEVLIHLKEEDVKKEQLEKYNAINSIPIDLRKIIKKNGVSVVGQLKIYNIIQENFETNYNLLNWTGYPNYEQLTYVLTLCWNNLIKEGESTRPMTLKKLVFMTFNYGSDKSIKKLYESNFAYMYDRNKDKGVSTDEIRDSAISEIHQISKHWFGYKIPKWLSVIDSLQKYICEMRNKRAGDYIFYSNEIENEFIPHNLSLLLEYGIPNTAIKKISKYLPSDLNDEDILKYISKNNIYKIDELLEYEKIKIIDTI